MRGADADPGAGPGRQADRAQARGAGARARRAAARPRTRSPDPRDRRQHAARCCSRAPRPTTRARSGRTAGRSTPSTRELARRWGIDPERDLRKRRGARPRALVSSSAQRWSASVSSGRALSRHSAYASKASASGARASCRAARRAGRRALGAPPPVAAAAEAVERVAAERVASASDSGRAFAGASISWSPFTSRSSTENVDRAALQPAEALRGSSSGTSNSIAAGDAPDDVVLLADVDVEARVVHDLGDLRDVLRAERRAAPGRWRRPAPQPDGARTC